MTKDAYYFSHDSNARNDEKILMLRAEHGMEGYGIYWALIEMMFENSDTKLSHDKIRGIAVSYNVDITLLESVINTCITEQLFDSDDESFWSESLLRRKGKFHDLKQKRSEAGKKGMAKRWGNKKKDNVVITNDNTDITKNNKGKERKVKDIYTPEFEEFWKVYPRKIEKKQAATKFKAKIKQYDLPTIVEGTKAYVQFLEENQTDKKYIKHAATFLNNDSFLEYSGSSEEPKEIDPQEEIRERKRELEMSIELGEEYWRKFETIEEYESMKKELEELEQL